MSPINNREELALDTINQVQLAIKSTGVYPEDHPITSEIINRSYESLVSLLNGQNRLDVSVNGSKLLVDDIPVESKNNFAQDLDQRAIDSISFYRGLSQQEYLVFLKAMIPSGKNGGVDSVLKTRGISSIRLNGIRYKKVTGDFEAEKLNDINGFDINQGLKEDPQASIINDFNLDDENPSAHSDKKISHPGKGDNSNQTFKILSTEPRVEENKTDDPASDHALNDRETVKEDINKLLSDRKFDEIQSFIEKTAQKIDDKSCEIRKKVAESLQELTLSLDEIGALKENFRKISDTLVNWIKHETHVDTYLTVAKNFHSICSSKNMIGSFLIDETIGSRLFENEKINRLQLQEALKARRKNGNSLQYNLGSLNLVDESILIDFLAQQHKDCPVVELSTLKGINEVILKTIPEKYIEQFKIFPFKSVYGNLYVATMTPNNWQVFKDIQFISGYSVVPHLAAEYFLLNSIEKFYNIKATKPLNQLSMNDTQAEDWNNGLEFIEDSKEATTQTEELKDSDVPIIKLANMIIKEAIKQNASDIHIEPYENELRVRFRLDGSLITALNPSFSYANGLASRIKIMSGLDISERRLPQDGRFKVRMDGKYVVFRVSTFPSIFGEKIVLRLLDDSNLVLDIEKLGLNQNDLTALLSAMYKSKGMVLVTGPTGSGKTTTIYSMLRGLNDGSLNIATAEDPIEYNLKGINQFQMNPKIGLSFARALKTFLRQDPDVIMVGEIRDLETAEIAFKAALTGHLVVSTLHTNDAAETITRLLNIGVEPYMITSSINLIVAQRLLRKICDKCKVKATPTDLQANVIEKYELQINGHQFFQGEGCQACSNTGYKGRVAVYEVMPMREEIQELILKGKSTIEIRKKAEKLGLTSLQAQGFNQVAAGITSLNEWMRVLA
jgi:type IV pilus assembly protein PilB